MARAFLKKISISVFFSGLLFFIITTITQGCGKNFADQCVGEYCAAIPEWDSPNQSHLPVEGHAPEGNITGSSSTGSSGTSSNDQPMPRRPAIVEMISPMLLEPGG